MLRKTLSLKPMHTLFFAARQTSRILPGHLSQTRAGIVNPFPATLFRSKSTTSTNHHDQDFLKTKDELLKRLSRFSTKLNILAHKNLQKNLIHEFDHLFVNPALLALLEKGKSKDKAVAKSWIEKRGYEIASELRRNLGLTDLFLKVYSADNREQLTKVVQSEKKYLDLLREFWGLRLNDLPPDPKQIEFISLQKALRVANSIVHDNVPGYGCGQKR